MKIISLLFILFILFCHEASSNNVQVSNVRLTGQNATDNFTMVEFDIFWENSWRYSGGPANWDAAWIFVKYRVGVGGEWQHAWLNDAGHITCGHTTLSNGFLSPSSPFHITTNPAVGVFIYRSTADAGNMACANVQLRWNYGANSISDDAQVDIRVFAIEMVYVPQSSFKVGDGYLIGGTFYQYNPTGLEMPYSISNENEIPVGALNGQLYYDNNSGNSGDRLGPIPATFPKGYNDFYMMKYEITQQGYVDFLNTLNRTQQISRVRANISGSYVTNQFVMENSFSSVANGIWSYYDIPIQPGPVLFSCNYNGNNIPGEIADGKSRACNHLMWKDMSAYLDWAALRPMTELEFEKGARGPLEPVKGEYSWGNNFIRKPTGISNIGSHHSTADTLTNVNCHPSEGPLRVGIFAMQGTDRTFSGAGYYGAMELTGNISEKVISLGNPAGRSFTGSHGNGLLDAIGNANVTSWPDPASANGIGNRGSCIEDIITNPRLRLSNREFGASDLITEFAQGGRGVRTAP